MNQNQASKDAKKVCSAKSRSYQINFILLLGISITLHLFGDVELMFWTIK